MRRVFERKPSESLRSSSVPSPSRTRSTSLSSVSGGGIPGKQSALVYKRLAPIRFSGSKVLLGGRGDSPNRKARPPSPRARGESTDFDGPTQTGILWQGERLARPPKTRVEVLVLTDRRARR